MKTILVPYDASSMSEAAARAAAEVGAATNGRLLLLHVHKTEHMRPEFQSGQVTFDEMRDEVQKLDAMKAKLEATHAGLVVECRVEQAVEKPIHTILDVARREHVDLIAMGTHGRTGLMHMALGSVAEEVVRKAPCPVLVTKAPA